MNSSVSNSGNSIFTVFLVVNFNMSKLLGLGPFFFDSKTDSFEAGANV